MKKIEFTEKQLDCILSCLQYQDAKISKYGSSIAQNLFTNKVLQNTIEKIKKTHKNSNIDIFMDNYRG